MALEKSYRQQRCKANKLGAHHFDCVLGLNTIHKCERDVAVQVMSEIQRIRKGRALVQVDSFRTPAQKEIFESWVLTAKFYDCNPSRPLRQLGLFC